MNLYILVDAKETERQVYKKWLEYLLPELKEVTGFNEITQHNYFLRHARHIAPSFRNRLKASILEINEANHYNYFVVCLDAEERTVEETITGVNDILEELNQKEKIYLLQDVKLEIIVQNKCIETWFLGNPKIITRNPHNKVLVEYIRYYDVSINDPEKMPLPRKSRFNTTAQFHFDYLRLLFAEKKPHLQ